MGLGEKLAFANIQGQGSASSLTSLKAAHTQTQRILTPLGPEITTPLIIPEATLPSAAPLSEQEPLPARDPTPAGSV